MKWSLLAVLLSVFPTSLLAVAPLIGDVPDQVIAQGTDTGTLYFTIGDAETTFTALTMSASSSNSTLVPNNAASLALGGTNSQRTIMVTPVAGQQGTAIITLTVRDGEALTAGSTFSVTVTAPNTRPTLTGLPGYQIVGPGEAPAAVGFTVGDAETAAGSLQVVATSSNTSLVPNIGLALGGGGASRTVQVTPVAGRSGSAVIRLRVSDALGASAQAEFIFSVFDAASANNGFRQPRGLYVLDSTAGATINGVPMRDGNIRNLPFVDGYVLRTEWATLEPANGVFDFTIITNIFARLPAGQKLSLMVASGVLPSWLNTLPGVTTYTAGSPAETLPVPWNATVQERYRLMLAALSRHLVDGVPLRDHPRLAVLDPWIPGLSSGIRPQTAQIRDIPGYSRPVFQNGVLTHLANATDNFPNVPVMIGFWTYTDATASPSAWEALRQAILAQHDGVARPRVGFWMENLAARRTAAEADPWTGSPPPSYTAPLYDSQNQTFIGYQVLGSWSRPFSSPHVTNTLNGSPEDGMDYGFGDYQCRYYEHYQADVDFAGYTAEFQRWHDFLNALPAPGATLPPPPATPAPAGATVTTGHGVTLTASAIGAIQWQISTNGGATYTNLANDSTYSGVTTALLTINTATDALNGALYRYTATANGATGTSAAATLTVAAAFLPFPVAVTADSAGNLYVADMSADTIQQVSATGGVTAFAGSAGQAGSADGTGAARFNDPSGLAVDATGTVSVADTANATIRRITAAGAVTTLAGSAGSSGSTDATGAAARFTAPIGLAQDSQGNLYVADSQNHTIRRVAPGGLVTTLAGTAGASGSTDGAGAAARFNNPAGVAVDAAGNVYVADTTNHTLRKIIPVGLVTTLAGLAGVSGSINGTGSDALFSQPGGLAIDSSGNLYVADTGNSTVRRVTPAGAVTTLAGLPTISGLKDGAGTDAWFNQPKSLALESGGSSLIVADTGNAALRRVTLAGTVTTLALTEGTTTPPPAPTPTPAPTPPPAPAPPSGGGGGGGGAVSPWFLAALATLALLRHWGRRPSPFKASIPAGS